MSPLLMELETFCYTGLDKLVNYLVPVVVHFLSARRAGSDGSMSTCGSAGPGFDSRRGSKFSF